MKGFDAEVISRCLKRGIAGTVYNIHRTVTDVERYLQNYVILCEVVKLRFCVTASIFI